MDKAAEDEDRIEVPVAGDMEVILITGMTIRIGEPVMVKDNGTSNIVEGVAKIIHIVADENNGMVMTRITVTEIIGIEIPMAKVILIGVEDGIIIIEVKDIVIVEEGEDGIPISNITIQGITRNPNFQIQIIIVHHPWDINTDTQSHMVNIRTLSSNSNIKHKCQLHHNRLQIFVSCVTAKVIMTINANLQATLWHAHKKPSIKADHIATKTLIMGNGHKAMMITMTLMGNLFSSGGSRCR